jgi:hypothetical protein
MPAPVVLFGACDRHNLGDLLFSHVAAALLPGRETRVAGLAERDLRAAGGHRVHALHLLAAEGRLHGAHLLHVGGEILGTSAREAAVMLLRPQDVDGVLAMLEREPGLESGWRQAMLGSDAESPYVAARSGLPGVGRIAFAGVGGVALERLALARRREVLDRLADADLVSVRDAITHAALRHAGVPAALVPDPVAALAHVFGEHVRARRQGQAVAEVLAAFRQGYVALQFPTEFGDDASLACAADRLAQLTARTGFGLVLFRTGAAPWHDDLALLVRLAARLPEGRARVFESLDVWDTCALLAHAHAYAGSSLHGAIVATAFGVAAAGLVRRDDHGQSAKLDAYLETWHAEEGTRAWPLDRIDEGVEAALQVDPGRRRAAADRRAAACCDAFARLASALD